MGIFTACKKYTDNTIVNNADQNKSNVNANLLSSIAQDHFLLQEERLSSQVCLAPHQKKLILHQKSLQTLN